MAEKIFDTSALDIQTLEANIPLGWRGWATTKVLAIYRSLLEGSEKIGETKRIFNLYIDEQLVEVTLHTDGTVEVGAPHPMS